MASPGLLAVCPDVSFSECKREPTLPGSQVTAFGDLARTLSLSAMCSNSVFVQTAACDTSAVVGGSAPAPVELVKMPSALLPTVNPPTAALDVPRLPTARRHAGVRQVDGLG